MENLPEGKLLGQKTTYPKTYDPSILVAVPRKANREIYAINDPSEIFDGFDVWHAWEFSFLLNSGMPVVGVLKIVYPANSKSIVESKSLKLYLNSFNQEKYGENKQEAIATTTGIIQSDLQKLIEKNVEIHYFDNLHSELVDFNDFEILEELPEVSQEEFTQFNEDKNILLSESDEKTELKVLSHLLRSNCKITHQPDWGSIFIQYKGNKKINKLSILKYIVSLRNENHFHEEICELMYKRIWDKFSPDELMVSCIYTRRGGIDISPVRANKTDLYPQNLINPKQLSPKLLRQ